MNDEQPEAPEPPTALLAAISAIRACLDGHAKPEIQTSMHFDASDHSGWSYTLSFPPGLSRVDITPKGPQSRLQAGTVFRHALLPSFQAQTIRDVLAALEHAAGIPHQRRVILGHDKYAPLHTITDEESGVHLGGYLTEEQRANAMTEFGYVAVKAAP